MNIYTRRLKQSKINIIKSMLKMTYCITILVEDQGRGLPVVLKSTVDGVVALVSTWHDDEESRRVEDGRMCVVGVL